MCESSATLALPFLATLAAFFSAIAALLSARSANTANKIAMRNEGLKIYQALLHFQSSLFSNKVEFLESCLFIFDEHIKLSHFYLHEIHADLEKVYHKTELIIQNVQLLRAYHYTDKQYVEIKNKISSDIASLRGFCSDIAIEMKTHLKIMV